MPRVILALLLAVALLPPRSRSFLNSSTRSPPSGSKTRSGRCRSTTKSASSSSAASARLTSRTDSDEYDQLEKKIKDLRLGGFVVFGGAERAPGVLLNNTYGR
jgi:hypothetical protein